MGYMKHHAMVFISWKDKEIEALHKILKKAELGYLVSEIVSSKMNEHQRAYAYFKEAAGKGLDSVDLFNNWAVSSYNLGKTEQSIRLLKHALVLDPEHPESHYNLGIAYSSKGMLKEAQREMALAMQLRNKSKK